MLPVSLMMLMAPKEPAIHVQPLKLFPQQGACRLKWRAPLPPKMKRYRTVCDLAKLLFVL
jgi:hypothetical protein